MEREYEQRVSDLEEWAKTLQASVDRHNSKLDTGTLNLRKSVDTMGGLLDSMQRQRDDIDQPIIAQIDPDDVARVGERTFLSPFTPLVHDLAKAFNKEELYGLASDIGVDMEKVGGSGLLDMCRKLIAYTRRRDMLHALLEMAAEERPGIDWLSYRVAPEERPEGGGE